jgi:outer membrane protein assembly factor BamE
MQKTLISSVFIVLLLLGCTHKIEIQQGNVVTQPQLTQLRVGMSEQEVRTLLGSPLLVDPFHPQRWDYLYSRRRGEQQLERYRLSLFFKGGRLERIEKEGEFLLQEYRKPAE